MLSDQIDLSDCSDAGDRSPKSPGSPLLNSFKLGDEKRRSTRKAELERKRLKLEEIKEQKRVREQEKQDKEFLIKNAKKKERRLSTEIDDLLSNPKEKATIDVKSQPKSKSVPHVLEQGSEVIPSKQKVNISNKSHKMKKLISETVSMMSIPPKEQVTYNRETQTSEVVDTNENKEDIDDLLLVTPPIQHKMPHVEFVYPALIPGEELLQKEEIPELTEEDKQLILRSVEFQNFFDRATKLVERALAEDVNIFIDYSGKDQDDQDRSEKSRTKLSLMRVFYDERWSKGRTVTSLDWSTQYPELLVASYNNNEDYPKEPDGIVLVWNTKFKTETPEYIFHCESEVMTTTFAQFHPNLIIGGTYCGQIVLWDNRSDKRVPVQRSPLSISAHTHPVYCLKVVGTSNAHNLISISTDGKFCSWTLDMLTTPQDTMVLQSKQTKAVPVTSLSFPYEDVNNFVIGSEEGIAYTACRHGIKAGIIDTYEAHQGPITGIDYHNSQGQYDFPQLFLTSSFDWTIKLWSVNDTKPLYSFEDNGEYVLDVGWSPIHPALFSTVDGMGRLDIWNLNEDTEVPTASTLVDNNIALNCLLWTPSGHQIAVGDDYGKIYLYEVEENLAVPNKNEWAEFIHTLQELKHNQVEDADNSVNKEDSLLFPLN